MRLPIDLGTPLPEPPRDIRTYACDLAEDLSWAYRLAREVTGFRHRSSEARYNNRLVEKFFEPGTLVRVIQRTHPSGVPSKLNPKFSGLCEVLEVRGPVLKLRELDTQRVFTANHDSIRRSTLQRPFDNEAVPPENTQLSSSSQHPASQQANSQPRAHLPIDYINQQPSIDAVRKKSTLPVKITTFNESSNGALSIPELNYISSNADFKVLSKCYTNSKSVPSRCTTNCMAAIHQIPDLINSSNSNSSILISDLISTSSNLFSSNYISAMDNIDSRELSLFEEITSNKLLAENARSRLLQLDSFDLNFHRVPIALPKWLNESGFHNIREFIDFLLAGDKNRDKFLAMTLEAHDESFHYATRVDPDNSVHRDLSYRCRTHSQSAAIVLSKKFIVRCKDLDSNSPLFVTISRATGDFVSSLECISLLI